MIEYLDYLKASTELQMTYSHIKRLRFNMITLLKTARMINLSLNPDKIQFKSTDCKFFGHRLTPEGLKPNPEKIKAIVDMKPPQSIQSLSEFQWYSKLFKKI